MDKKYEIIHRKRGSNPGDSNSSDISFPEPIGTKPTAWRTLPSNIRFSTPGTVLRISKRYKQVKSYKSKKQKDSSK